MPRPQNSTPDISDSPAELNPLLNPVLGEHMGRWAEVYFTNPPELRDAAVLDLLHELQERKPQVRNSHANNTGPSARTSARIIAPWPGPSGAASREDVAPQVPSPFTMTKEPSVRCDSCGHENPALHRFCGGCGAPLDETTLSENTADHSRTSAGEPYLAAQGTMSSRPESGTRETAVDEIRARLDPQRREFEESIVHPHELSLFRSFRERESVDDEWNEAPTHRRLLIGAALVILIAGAVYMAWRSGQLSAQRAHEAQPANATASKDASAPPAGNGNVSQPTPPQASNAAPPVTAQEQKTPPAAKPVQAADHGDKAIQRVSRSSIVAQPSAPSNSIDTGNAELAVAQRYLDGDYGRRNSAEAAKWLWKSISKHNGEATLLLADLYLKGDGVSKNCDQARVLLDSAGRKGVPGAGMRLRNLQAFGCQ